ncbi:hypothetical protein PV325_000717 [Microctonus aethiopoides]|nr:hypothetical protein PV325_000717 [Microctonus aethiopoides]
MIAVRENEEFNPPRHRINTMIMDSRNFGCNTYVILIGNGLQLIELLQYCERQKSGEIIIKEWFNLESISYPIDANDFIITHHIDTWYKGKFRNGREHFFNKTVNLERKILQVAVFEHIPAVTKQWRKMHHGSQNNGNEALGIEIEIIKIIAEKINFQSLFYHLPNIDIDKWDESDENGSHSGLLGETMETNADFFLGDFHYTLRNHQIFELSYPYNTECLTFITPESLTQNSWMLLIIPFKLYTWIAVILLLLVAPYILCLFALFYQKQIMPFKKKSTATKAADKQLSNVTTTILKRTKNLQKQNNIDEQLKGLQLFTDIQNGMLYTYGMLLQVSLPRLPKAWALRLFIGWWWLYSILITVAYRASMTASLANPVARITIDTLAELATSTITVGGWGEEKHELFISSSDKNLRKIGEKFEQYENVENAMARVANGSFGYYENIYLLQEVRAKRQLFEAVKKKKATENNENLIADRDLHIMKECVIFMPISIGMNRNSPLKPQVDQLVRNVVESGLVEKWLSDVIEWSKIAEIRYESDAPKALVDLHKLYGALIALGIGYLLGFISFTAENFYWKYVVMKNPAYDKYQMDAYYAINKTNI